MYGTSVLLNMDAPRCHINRTEIFCRVDVDIIVHFLYTLHILKSVLHQDLRTDMHHGYLVSHISFAYKMLVFIVVEHFLYDTEPGATPRPRPGLTLALLASPFSEFGSVSKPIKLPRAMMSSIGRITSTSVSK